MASDNWNVSIEMRERMLQVGDTPVQDSVFLNWGPITTELGMGTHNYYYATNAPTTGWITFVRPVVGQVLPTKVVDMRGKLPTRAGATPYPQRPVALVTQAIIHYTAAPPERTVLDIANYQVTTTGSDLFPAIAYHLFVEKDGTVVWCHDFDKRTWGSGEPGANNIAVHICYSGNIKPNPAQLVGLRTARHFAEASPLLGRPLAVEGHSDGYATQCPGATWPTWKAAILG